MFSNMSFLNNFFSSATPNNKFYPMNINGIGSAEALWLSNEANEYYGLIPEFRAIIDQQANMFLKPDIKLVDSKGNELNDPFLELLKNPNPFQDRIEFISNFYKIFNTNDFVFVWLDKRGFNKIGNQSKMYALSGADLEIQYNSIRTPNHWREAVLHVAINLPFSTGEQIVLSGDELNDLYFLNNSGVSFADIFTGSPKIKAAQKPLSNISAVYESENVLLTKRGAIGIFSPENPKDQYGDIDQNDIEAIQEDLNRYGMLDTMKRFMVVSKPIKFIRTVLSPKEFDFKGSLDRNTASICSIWGHDVRLLNNTDSSTFNNIEQVKSGIYENKILPDWDKVINFFQSNFITSNGELKYFTDNISSLAKDEKQAAEKNKIESDTIINLNNAVLTGSMTKQNAVALLVNMGIEEDTANSVINEQSNERESNIQGEDL